MRSYSPSLATANLEMLLTFARADMAKDQVCRVALPPSFGQGAGRTRHMKVASEDRGYVQGA